MSNSSPRLSIVSGGQPAPGPSQKSQGNRVDAAAAARLPLSEVFGRCVPVAVSAVGGGWADLSGFRVRLVDASGAHLGELAR